MKTLFLITCVLLSCCSEAQSLYFPPTTGDEWETINPETLNWCPEKIDALNDFLDTSNTKAFILLKDGKIVIESYFDDHTATATWYWASAGKTITSFMTGIAQQENFLSIEGATTTYLGDGWTSCSSGQENAITIRHQLTMTSGLDDGVVDPYCTTSDCLICLTDPSTRWAYHNAPYTLLDQVIENATSQTLNGYTTQKLKNPTGMTGLFIPVESNNVFFSNARSMARFGLLILNNGNWDGNQIMTDATYFNQMINTSQPLNESYGYLWWLNGKPTYMLPGLQTVFNGFLFPNAPEDTYAALGKNGQFLNVIPSENLVWIRMGEDPSELPVPYLLNDAIWEYINDLECETMAIDQRNADDNFVILTPNPANAWVTITSKKQMSNIELYTPQGQLIQQQSVNEKDIHLSIRQLKTEVYFLKIYFNDNRFRTVRIIKK